jgi:hypothetical protein
VLVFWPQIRISLRRALNQFSQSLAICEVRVGATSPSVFVLRLFCAKQGSPRVDKTVPSRAKHVREEHYPFRLNGENGRCLWDVDRSQSANYRRTRASLIFPIADIQQLFSLELRN